MKQGIRLIDKTDLNKLEINLDYYYWVIVRKKFEFWQGVLMNDNSHVASG